jgi:branched-chain amino acid transport system ATP-binding protein
MELRAGGLSMLVIDKDIDALCVLADRHYVLEKGHVVWHGASRELFTETTLQNAFIGF